MWQILKSGLRSTKRRIEHTRLETWATPGVPDVVLCGEEGAFCFLELKIVKHKKIDLSPHQCAWLSRHAHANCWIITRDSSLAINVYHGSAVVDLRMDGVAAVTPVAIFSEDYDWEKFYTLICPLD